MIAQLVQSESQAPLHGPERQLQELGRLRVRKVAEVDEREDLQLRAREGL